jgi:hypothetical protein
MSLKDLKERLSRYRQLQITVTGRKSGRALSVPVWFVVEEEKLYLLPVRGSDTQWYKNIRASLPCGSPPATPRQAFSPPPSQYPQKFRLLWRNSAPNTAAAMSKNITQSST